MRTLRRPKENLVPKVNPDSMEKPEKQVNRHVYPNFSFKFPVDLRSSDMVHGSFNREYMTKIIFISFS